MMTNIITVSGVSKRFGKKQVLDNISFSVKKGEILGILGKNGAGKTVLINILLGLIKPDSGTVKIFGKDLEQNLSQIRQRINVASPFLSLQTNASIYDNLLLFARLYGNKNPTIKISELTKEFQIEKLAKTNKKLLHLSTGELTRAILAKAFLNDPDIIFLDEPAAALDPLAKERVMQLIKKRQKMLANTFVYTSHDLTEIVKLCSQVLILKSGKISYIGPIISRQLLKNKY